MPPSEEDATGSTPRGAERIVPQARARDAEPWDQAPPDDDEIDLGRYLRVIARRKWTVLAVFAVAVVVAAVVSLLTTPVYRASLALQIERSEANLFGSGGDLESREAYQTQIELLKSRGLAQRVITDLRLDEHPTFAVQDGILARLGLRPSEEELDPARRQESREGQRVERFLKLLQVEAVRNSHIVRLHFEHPDAELAVRVVGAVADAYRSLYLERRLAAFSDTNKVLSGELSAMKARLEEAERAANQFARDNEIIRIDEKPTVVDGLRVQPASADGIRLREFTMAHALAQQERIQAEAIYQRMREVKNPESIPGVPQNASIQRYKEAKARLEAELQEELKAAKPGETAPAKIQARITDLQARINEEAENVRLAITSSFETAKRKEALIEAKLRQAKSSMLGLQDRSVDYNVLRREAETNRQLYEAMLQRYKEIGVVGGIGRHTVSIVEPAAAPRRPVKPNLAINLLLGAALGVVLGVGLALYREHRDTAA